MSDLNETIKGMFLWVGVGLLSYWFHFGAEIINWFWLATNVSFGPFALFYTAIYFWWLYALVFVVVVFVALFVAGFFNTWYEEYQKIKKKV